MCPNILQYKIYSLALEDSNKKPIAMTATHSRTSMFNLTRPTRSVNIYVSLTRLENHLWYLVNLSLSARDKKIPIEHLSPIDFEIKWCFNSWIALRNEIEASENGSFPFGA